MLILAQRRSNVLGALGKYLTKRPIHFFLKKKRASLEYVLLKIIIIINNK